MKTRPASRKRSIAPPEYLAEQAEEMMKSSYNLEFLGTRRKVKERESFHVTLVELRDKIDSFLSPGPALA